MTSHAHPQDTPQGDRDALRERYAEALHSADYVWPIWRNADPDQRALAYRRADAVLAVRDEEIEALRHGIDGAVMYGCDLGNRAEAAEATLAAIRELCDQEDERAQVLRQPRGFIYTDEARRILDERGHGG